MYHSLSIYKSEFNRILMMPSAQYSDSVIAALVEARTQSLKAASEARNVEELMTWYSANAVLQDKVRDKSVVGIDELRKYYSDAYTAIPTFRIVKANSTAPTVDFVAAEMSCEGVAAFDMPAGNVKAGDTLSMIGVSLFWWRWEGPGEKWDGDLSEAGIKGWKIIREHLYFQSK